MSGAVSVAVAADRVAARAGDRVLFEYVFAPDVPAAEVPKPYFHPVRTLAGEVVTLFRPHDHPWHHGIAMTCPGVSGENFWGGPTYVKDADCPEGTYRDLDNRGVIRHDAWIRPPGGRGFAERLSWIARDGRIVLAEERTAAVEGVDEAAGRWTLALSFTLANRRDAALRFTSPTVTGRPMAGYGGLFWRGPRSWLHGRVAAAGGLAGPEIMGTRAAWLSFTGRHDGTLRASTVAIADDPGNPRHPTKWFVRNDPYACASASFIFDEAYDLAPGATLSLRYRILVADGDLAPGAVDAWAAGLD